MPSDLQVTNLKANDGTAGISIADSTGRVSFTDTNPVITLGSNTTFRTGSLVKSTFIKIQSGTVNSSPTTFARLGIQLFLIAVLVVNLLKFQAVQHQEMRILNYFKVLLLFLLVQQVVLELN